VSKTGKNDAAETEAAIKALIALATEAMSASEPYLISALPALLKAAASKATPVRNAASEAVTTITSKMTCNSVREVLPILFAASKIEENWQTRTLALKTIAGFGDHAPVQLGCALPQVVPEVTTSVTDTKKEVAAAAISAMTASCDVIGNRDIEHMTSHILKSITNPEEVPEIMHTLAGVTFVQSVQSPALPWWCHCCFVDCVLVSLPLVVNHL
jgi:elongation factor 3